VEPVAEEISADEAEVRHSLGEDKNPHLKRVPPSPVVSPASSRLTRSATKSEAKKTRKRASPKPSPRKSGRRGKSKTVATSSRVSLGERVESESDSDSIQIIPTKAPRARPNPVLSSKKAGKAKEASVTPFPDPVKEGSSTPPLPATASVADLHSIIPRFDASRFRSVEDSLRDLRLVCFF
jgi:hypothetical protein